MSAPHTLRSVVCWKSALRSLRWVAPLADGFDGGVSDQRADFLGIWIELEHRPYALAVRLADNRLGLSQGGGDVEMIEREREPATHRFYPRFLSRPTLIERVRPTGGVEGCDETALAFGEKMLGQSIMVDIRFDTFDIYPQVIVHCHGNQSRVF